MHDRHQIPLRPRVAILMAESGGGHRAAAISLSEALQDDAHVEFLNLLDEHTPFPLNRLSNLYGRLVDRSPRLYHLLYRAASSRHALRLALIAAYSVSQTRLVTAFKECEPDLVISVHPLLNAVALQALRTSSSQAPFVTVVTDPITPPLAWFCPGVDLCIVASEEARQVALGAGMPPQRVQVIGLPIRLDFVDREPHPKPEMRAGLGLNPSTPLILLAGGGAGLGNLVPFAKALTERMAQGRPWGQIAIVAGHNRELRRRLEAVNWPAPVRVLGFVENIADWMAAANLLVTKAGPGMLTEAMALGLPVIMTGFVPGQEEGNVRWVESAGAGVFEDEPARVASLAEEWLSPDSESLSEMGERAQSIAHPHASRAIARAALDCWRANSSS